MPKTTSANDASAAGKAFRAGPGRDARAPGTAIEIRGASQNNLKNLDLDITPGTLTVITGPSGSGKSSLAFDTLYAEGQRRYVETFSPYARQFLERCDRPKVERIDGVPPAIAINQSNTVRTSRSTVGTMTELNDYLKLVFARDAKLFCGTCGTPVKKMSAREMFDELKAWAAPFKDARIAVCFTLVVPASLDLEVARAGLSAQGFTHIVKEEVQKKGRARGETRLTVACDRFRLSKCSQARGVEAFEKALAQTRTGAVTIVAVDEAGATHERFFAAGLTCPKCLRTYAEPSPARFSFNSAVGACETCRGFGRVIGLDLGLVIPDENLTLAQGAIKPWQGTGVSRECQDDMMRFARRDKIRTNVPFKDLTAAEKSWVIEGEPGWRGDWRHQWYGVRAFFSYLESKSYKMHVRVMLSRFRSYNLCPACRGARLKPESLFWRLGSREAADKALGLSDAQGISRKGTYQRFVPCGMGEDARAALDTLPGLTIPDLMDLPVARVKGFFEDLAKTPRDEASALVINETLTRLNYLIDVGVGYLTLGRQSRTLSGGEVQRVNLTTALGTNLVDTLFVLDEPSVGLHPRDMDRVNGVMKKLKDAGNTLVVVEHDPQVMLAADRIIDMGPGSGAAGGSIVYDGPAKEIRKAHTLTGLYLSGALSVDSPSGHVRPSQFRRWVTLKGASEHNLKHIDFRFPLGALTAVTGVSGSGKSTLVGDVLVPALTRKFGRPATPGAFDAIEGAEGLEDVVYVDQSPIGKSSRSNPVLYVGAFTRIRELFASTPAAAERGYTAGTFSFNSGTGRCPTCQGAGFERVEMQFLSDVLLKCPDCDGRRYRPETLEVTINFAGRGEKSIADVLEMTVAQALAYFKGDGAITSRLAPLADVGLDYVLLGQSVSTLSGGEAQRLKLAEILAQKNPRRAGAGKLYVFDEPTTGLHFDDIEKLLRALRRLVQRGNTVLVVEHNLDVISSADWIVDLGPEGGDEGGTIVAEGTPAELETAAGSYTGRALAAYHDVIGPEGSDMQGVFEEAAPQTRPAAALASRRAAGRSLQSVWKRARAGDMGIFGAREHNLKNIDVVIPKKELTVVTGVSGSGKSTLAFGIIFSEGQRRYLESLNAYARSIAQPETRADVEQVTGIAPTVAIEQRTSRGGRKSTVSTMTEIQHFLRLLYVKLGMQHCPACGAEVTSRSKEAIISEIMTARRGEVVTVAAPVVVARKGIYTDLAEWAAETLGIGHLRVDGEWAATKPFPKLARYKEHTIELPLATLVVDPKNEHALAEAVQKALFHGHGVMVLLTGPFALTDAPSPVAPQSQILSTKRACPHCMTSFPDPDPRLFSFNSKIGWCPTCFGTGRIIKGFDAEQTGEEAAWRDAESTLCPDCGGARLNPVARAVYFEGRSICETTALSVDDCLEAMKAVRLVGRSAAIGADALKEIISRLEFLQKVGLGYLSLDRDAPSLSGGEAQRIRLASQLGSSLQGVCYVLDEPTIGLHPRDNARLIDTLAQLKDKGNTVIVVEHDEEMIRRADHIVDIGPGAGSRGGRLLVEGTIDEVEAAPESITGRMLRAPLQHTGIARRKVAPETASVRIAGAMLHNLKRIAVRFPLGRLIVLTGVSGSGKSTLARDVLLSELKRAVASRATGPVKGLYCERIEGVEALGRVLEVDQSPIGKTPRSCPATYVGFFNHIRDLYAATNEAQAHGYGATRFSFNTPEGRCPVCEGQGEVTVEMSFLPDVKVLCEACRGMRFDEETLSVKWQGKSIGEVLNLSVDDALEVFASSPRIARPLELLAAVGLGYLRLGQPSSTLSGGEAQRIKLVTELAKALSPAAMRRQGATFYILDEPTVGLHMADVEKLVNVLHRLVDAGNTVLVVEHNLDVMAEADWLIDLGPEGGPEGGEVLFEGEPADASRMDTPTGRALKEFLSSHKAQADADDTGKAEDAEKKEAAQEDLKVPKSTAKRKAKAAKKTSAKTPRREESNG